LRRLGRGHEMRNALTTGNAKDVHEAMAIRAKSGSSSRS
jgi:hypothetical protein